MKDNNKIPTFESETIIVTFVDNFYMDIFDIWYSYFVKLNLINLLVVSLDNDTYNNLKYRNINTILRVYSDNKKVCEDRNDFWRFRLEKINEIFISTKKNIIHTDSDCIWFKDIYKIVKDLEYDFVGSIEHGHPYAMSSKHGFIMCCGFYYIKYNEQNKKFLSKMVSTKQHGTDDQVKFNYYMFNNLLKLTEDCSDIIKYEIQTIDIKIGLLSENIISRYDFNGSKDIYAYHPCLRDKTVDLKKKDLLSKIDKNLYNY
jgi:hypothetical protein